MALAGSLMAVAPAAAMAANPTPSPIPCLPTLKFAGALYLDADTAVPDGEVGPQVGQSDPNPAHCGLPAGIAVYRHAGHLSSDEIAYRRPDGRAELLRSGGSTGFPMQDIVKWLVLALVVGIVAFAAIPAILAHVRQPPIEVGRADEDIFALPDPETAQSEVADRIDGDDGERSGS